MHPAGPWQPEATCVCVCVCGLAACMDTAPVVALVWQGVLEAHHMVHQDSSHSSRTGVAAAASAAALWSGWGS